MTIHAFAGERASRTHENQMLQAFLERLESRWADSTDWIYVIANAMWEGAEVDLVCVLPCAILVADFKNYKGRLTGSENGPWQVDGVVVKGGARTNPFVQLRENRFSVINWINRKHLLQGRNVGHISAGAVFSGPIDNQIDISPKSKSWFQATDLDHCASLLDSLASTGLSLKESEAADIVHLLGVGAHDWQSSRPRVHPVGGDQRPERVPLTQHQQEALVTIRSFVETTQHISLSVCGMTSTGKTRLLADAVSEIERQGRAAIPLVPNRRLSWAAREVHGMDCHSVYQHLYVMSVAEGSDEVDSKEPKVMPMRECVDSEDCVYLIDDAHLLGNTLFKTPDGKRFGTGHLLEDLFDFAEIGKSKRQIIFFGDPYQLSRASGTDSVLDGSFLAARELPHQEIELEHLIDTTGGSALIHNARLFVEAIRGQQFATLRPREDDSFRVIDKRQAAAELLEHFKTNPSDVWYLTETHRKVGEFTRWLRPNLHGKSELDSVEPGEFLEIFTPVESKSSNPFTDFVKLEPGQRVRVEHIGPSEGHFQPLKGRERSIEFATRMCKFAVDGLEQVELLEDFLLAELPELPVDTMIAVGAWVKAEKHHGFAHARYGYATTVHHAQGMKQPLCYVNAELAAGRHSEAYFRWLYTAVTRADRSAVVFNFESIHPFDSATWNPAAAKQSANIPVGTGWQFDPEAPISEHDQKRDVPTGLLDQSKDPRISVAVWLRIAGGVEEAGWRIAKVVSHSYEELLELTGPRDQSIRLRIVYNGKNVVTVMHLSDPAQWQLLSTIAVGCLMGSTYCPSATMLLASLQSRVNPHGWQALSVSETNYRLVVTLAQGADARVSLELKFDKQGLVSSICPLQFSELALLEQIRSILL